MSFFHATGRLVRFLFKLGVAGGVGIAAFAVSENALRDGAILVGVLAALFTAWLLFRRGRRRGRGRDATVGAPATVMAIDHLPRPGAPWYYWTYVTFDRKGERIRLHLGKRQALKLADTLSVGDVGILTHAGDKLLEWREPTSEEPLPRESPASTRPRVFLSYAHEWADDARYVSEFLASRGLDVWVDRSQLRFGDQLDQELKRAIQDSDVFVPLLSTEYWTSEWCVDEFEIAAQAAGKVIPIKVSDELPAMPPHIRTIYREKLGDPVFLDLRGRNPVAQLDTLARQILEDAKGVGDPVETS
jgi:hypothetical protein